MEETKSRTRLADRRAFLKRAGVAAASVPAATLLLSAEARAVVNPYSPPTQDTTLPS